MKKSRRYVCVFALSILVGTAHRLPAQGAPAGQRKTRNVVLIVADGLRWQEIFTGAEEDLMNDKEGGMWAKPEELRRDFWREDVNERRKALFPFLWGTVAQRGQIFGNQNKGSDAHVTNGQAFSYPGYNEMLAGYPDPKIDSNEFGTNPNVTVTAGGFTASKIDIRVFDGGTELKDAHFTLHLANNAFRTPVLLEAIMPFATARVELVKEK